MSVNESFMKNVSEVTVVEEKDEIDSESEDSDVSPFVLTPISFRSLVGHDDEVNACCFSPNWTRLISGGDDCVVKVWDTSSGQPVFTLRNHTGTIGEIAFFLLRTVI